MYNTLRKPKYRFYYEQDTPTRSKLKKDSSPSIQTFIICLDVEQGLNSEGIRSSLEEASKTHNGDSFITGMLVLGENENNLFYSHSVNIDKSDIDNRHKVYCETKNSLMKFKWRLLRSLSRCVRFPLNCTPAIDTYSTSYQNEVSHPEATSTVSLPPGTNSTVSLIRHP